MTSSGGDSRQAADELRASGDYVDAGDTFTRAQYRYLSEVPYGTDLENSAIGQGLYCLLSAALCYGVAQNQTPARNRCRQGVLLASDLRRYVADEPALTGFLYECQGDFACIGAVVTGGSSAESADSYTRAIDLSCLNQDEANIFFDLGKSICRVVTYYTVMYRRTILAGGITLSVSLAGCLDSSVGWREEPAGDESEKCPTTHVVEVVAVTDLPDDENVYDAESDGFTDVETIANALSEADAKYKAGRAVDASDPDNLSYDSDDILARESTTTENNEVQNLLFDFPFVEYQEQMYYMTWAEIIC